MAGVAEPGVNAGRLEQRANLIVGELHEQVGQERAAGLTDDGILQSAGDGFRQVPTQPVLSFHTGVAAHSARFIAILFSLKA